ncbi:MAG: sigma-70 family RNA polymerase sigma factor [Polyangiaceae bacterium]
MIDTLPDEELLRRIGAGDVSAAGVLYDRYSKILFPIALRILRDRAEAEDLLHDAFVAVAERAGQYTRERGTVAAWLITLVRNLTIDRTRRRERRGAIARDIVAFEPVEAVPDPETLVGNQAGRLKVTQALASLPEVQRATLVAAFFEGLTYPEIAEREKVPIGTVKSRAARALASLRESLAREGFDFDDVAEVAPATAPSQVTAGRGST